MPHFDHLPIIKKAKQMPSIKCPGQLVNTHFGQYRIDVSPLCTIAPTSIEYLVHSRKNEKGKRANASGSIGF
jgi:hypothetical protein